MPLGPHVALHALDDDHPETSHPTGHAMAVLHTRVCMRGHFTPPCASTLMTLTGRTCWPPLPHVFVHGLHGMNWCSQSTGHARTLQSRSSYSGGHAAPPYWLLAMSARSRRWTPPPQSCEHSLQAP
jgi:hypothetical protein